MNHLIAAAAVLALAACNAPPVEEQKPEEQKPEEKKPAEGDVAKETPKPPSERQGPAQIPAPDDVATAPADAQKSESGLAWTVLKPGTGADKPAKHDRVTVHYTGWTADGKMFDSSVARGAPATFPLNRVIPGWTEGVSMMVTGEKRRFWIPANLAYGDKPMRPGAPSGQLTFDVELLEIEKMPEPPKMPEVPKDVAAAPKDAKKTASGLAYKVLENKDGGKKPAATDKVKVHYTGWTTDGKMFDSSIPRGQPAIFPLNQVIPGWTEGVQLMDEGDSYRFWIPGKLAYGDTPTRPGAPAGTLVFEITLLEVMK